MKKLFYVMLSAAALCLFTACGTTNPPEEPEEETPEFLDQTKESQMVISVGDEVLTGDKTIEVTEYEENELTGERTMGVRGLIRGANAFRVSITRSEAEQKDELCAGVQCVPGDGELAQEIDYHIPGGGTDAEWYTHYTPAKEGVYTVAYKFQNYNRTITLTVKYNYQAK